MILRIDINLYQILVLKLDNKDHLCRGYQSKGTLCCLISLSFNKVEMLIDSKQMLNFNGIYFNRLSINISNLFKITETEQNSILYKINESLFVTQGRNSVFSQIFDIAMSLRYIEGKSTCTAIYYSVL